MDEESKEDWLEKKFSARQLAEKVVAAESESSRLRRRCNKLEKSDGDKRAIYKMGNQA